MESGKDLNAYPVPAFEAEATIDFLESRDLGTLEDGVRRLGEVSDLMGLVQGLAICKIELEGLWQEAGYANLRAYRVDQADRLGLPLSTISNRRKVGEAWMRWGKAIGRFKMTGHVRKLLFLNAAMENHRSQEKVLEHFKKDSSREFEAWARGSKRIAGEGLPDVDVSIQGNTLLLDGEEVLEMEEGLPDEEKAFLSSVLRDAYRARAGKCIPHVVPVYDKGEARAIDNFLKKRRAGS